VLLDSSGSLLHYDTLLAYEPELPEYFILEIEPKVIYDRGPKVTYARKTYVNKLLRLDVHLLNAPDTVVLIDTKNLGNLSDEQDATDADDASIIGGTTQHHTLQIWMNHVDVSSLSEVTMLDARLATISLPAGLFLPGNHSLRIECWSVSSQDPFGPNQQALPGILVPSAVSLEEVPIS
jgi:hypothetical protein